MGGTYSQENGLGRTLHNGPCKKRGPKIHTNGECRMITMSDMRVEQELRARKYARPVVVKLGHMLEGVVAKSIGAHDTQAGKKPVGS